MTVHLIVLAVLLRFILFACSYLSYVESSFFLSSFLLLFLVEFV